MLRNVWPSLMVVAVLAMGAVAHADDNRVVGVRGSGVERFNDEGLSAGAGRVSRSDFANLLKAGKGQVVSETEGALKLEFADGQYWVKREQVRLERTADYVTDCSQKLAGVSTGASRGIGGNCKK